MVETPFTRPQLRLGRLHYTLESFPMRPPAGSCLQRVLRAALLQRGSDSFDIQLSENRGTGTVPGNLLRGPLERPSLSTATPRPLFVELNGIEPSTSGLQSPRSPS